MKTPSQKIIVIYHGDCPDGFGGAYAAWKKFGARAAYLPAFNRDALPCPLKGKEVYLIDYTYHDEALMRRLVRDNVRVTAIDHHITAEPFVRMTQDASFSLDHSGAVLAWRYFHPKKKIPALLRYIEDRDLWRWKVPGARAVLARFDLEPMELPSWDRAAKALERAGVRKEYRAQGALLLRHAEALTDALLTGADMVRFAGREVYAVNAPRRFASEMGNTLARRTRSFAIIWREASGIVNVSLRSDGSVDVASIARCFGGGGHKAAAGFSFPVGKGNAIVFPWKIVKHPDSR